MMKDSEQKNQSNETTTTEKAEVKISKLRGVRTNLKSGCRIADGGGGGGYCASYCW